MLLADALVLQVAADALPDDIRVDSFAWALLAAVVIAGVGISMAIPSAQNSVLGSVSEEAVGKAAGTNSVMRELGGVFDADDAGKAQTFIQNYLRGEIK